MESLREFIKSNPDSRELKRALAVQMSLEGYTHSQITQTLNVSSGFISKWKNIFFFRGLEGLKLGYKGSEGYLSVQARRKVIDWLKASDYWNLGELEYHLADQYGVIFKSKQSYYELFKEAGISWKKSQNKNPGSDPDLVEAKKKEIRAELEKRRTEIDSGELVVFIIDECHLLWVSTVLWERGEPLYNTDHPSTQTDYLRSLPSLPVRNSRQDICGYLWGYNFAYQHGQPSNVSSGGEGNPYTTQITVESQQTTQEGCPLPLAFTYVKSALTPSSTIK